MGLDFRIDGGDQLRKVVAQVRAEADKGLGKELSKALERAMVPVRQAIEVSAGEVMPKRGGYAGILTRSLKHRRTTRASSRDASVRLTSSAKGKVENRDLPSLNAGALRHPVFGRRKTWTVTAIRAGFHDRAVEKAGPGAEDEVLKVLDDFIDRLAKG
jgi:hypothetical protein